MTLRPTRFLHLALLGDAAASAATGLLLAAAPIAGLLGLPESLLRVAGLALLLYAAFVGWVGRSAAPPRAAVRAIIAVNVVWVLDSVALLALGPALAGLSPTALGTAFVLAQAAAVAGFAAAQAAAMRGAAKAQPA
ncbi:hypothetical protein [Sabulicella rubraurantiaca]|uniref:hypothetical protein n=1 Tax=Sabulicella rubraurantiaca TaxID=2811429 RepID=UPI001A96D492|nr:hypothetical protein [Sabulicella rubraurantiaca]